MIIPHLGNSVLQRDETPARRRICFPVEHNIYGIIRVGGVIFKIRQAGGRMVKRTIFFRSEPQSPGTSRNCIDFCGDRLAGFDGYEASGIGCRILEGERQHLIDILLGEQLKGKSSGQVLQVQAGCQFERNSLLECVIFDRLSGFFQ